MKRLKLLPPGLLLAANALASADPVPISPEHRAAVDHRHRRVIVQQDVEDWVARDRNGRPPGEGFSFARFERAVFAAVDTPGSQIDGIWWDIAGGGPGATYPSSVQPPPTLPVLRRWLAQGVDWVQALSQATRRRHLEDFWNYRISEVDLDRDSKLQTQELSPLKAAHPDWTTPSWWWQGNWNLQSAGLRAHKLAELTELAAHYDFDGFQIDFSRHTPFLPVGRQWENRDSVTAFMRSVRLMLLAAERRRGHPLLLAAKVPETLGGCRIDGLDVAEWAREHLIDILTLGSRTIDVRVEEFRRLLGPGVQLQPCLDDHHAPDGYRFPPLSVFLGTFDSFWARGADSVVTFNWSIGPADAMAEIGAPPGPPQEQAAYLLIGERRAMKNQDKVYALDRRGGYPWSDGFANRNDEAPLPKAFSPTQRTLTFPVYVSQGPEPGFGLEVWCVLSSAQPDASFHAWFNGQSMALRRLDRNAKDPQIFAPLPQPASGGDGIFTVNPGQRLLQLVFGVPAGSWHRGINRFEIAGDARTEHASGGAGFVHLEKIECHLHHPAEAQP